MDGGKGGTGDRENTVLRDNARAGAERAGSGYGLSRQDWKYCGILTGVTVFAALVFFAAAFLPPQAVWITDNGGKWMILRQFAEKGTIFFHPEVPENFPLGGFHFQLLPDGRASSFHPPWLSVLASLPYRWAGDFGGVWIPMFCGAALAGLLCRFRVNKVWLFAAVAATPLFFYSLLLWEMVPAALAVTLAAWLFSRRRFTVAGMIFGLGVWMREELYLLGACLLVVLLCRCKWREIWRFGLGAASPVLALWLANVLLFGHAAGLHGATYFANNRPEAITAAGWFREVVFNAYQHIVRFETLPKYSGIIAAAAILPALAAGLAPEYRAWKPFKAAAAAIFTGAAVIFAAGLWKREDYLFVSAETFGLFLSVPPLLGMMLHIRALCRDRRDAVRTGAAVMVLYTVSVPFLLNPHDIGLTWGARHFLVVLPLMLVLSVHAFSRGGWSRSEGAKAAAILLCAAGISMQIYALRALVKVASDAEYFQNEILALPQKTVVSDLFFLPEMTPRVPFAKQQLEVTGSARFAAALDHLERNGCRSFILLLSPDYRRMDNRLLAELLRRYPVQAPPAEFTIGNSLKIYLALCALPPNADAGPFLR